MADPAFLPLAVGSALNPQLTAGRGEQFTIDTIASLLMAAGAYWAAAALALFFFAFRRRPGRENILITAVAVWLSLRVLGAILRFLIPCLAPDAEASFGFVVGIGLAFLLPLRLWQRALCLAIVALTASAWAYALRCRLPGELGLVIGLLLVGAALVWLLGRWPLARQHWQRVALALDNLTARRARTPLTPTLQAVLAARLRQHLGFTVEDLAPVDADGVHASTPVIVTGHTAEGRLRRYFVKIVSAQNWLSSLTFHLWRWLLHRGKVPGGPIQPSLKALVEYEYYMLLLFAHLGVPAPRPRGLYRLGRQVYALVTDYLEGVQSLRGVGEVPAQFVTQAFWALRRLREADCAHRDIKASNIVVLPGHRFAFVDLAMAENIAGPKRLAQDLADMLATMAMHHDPERVVDIALNIIGPEGLHKARPYLHRTLLNSETQKMMPLELPRQLRGLIRERARLHAQG